MKKKMRARYGEKKQRKSDRRVMSYEDMPLDDYEQEKTEMSPDAVKKIILAVCIAVVAGLAVFAFSNRDKLTWDNISTWWTYDVLGNAGSGYPVNIVGSEVSASNFAVSQGRSAYASDTSFVTLNSTGSEVANIQLRYSTPVLKSEGNRYLTFGIGSTGYQIQSFDKMLYSGEAEENILTGDINADGVYCLVTEGNGYLSTLCAFDKNNNRIYKYSFSEYYITAVALKSDGSGCIACGITSNNGAVAAGIYQLDFTNEEPKAFYTINDDCIIDCQYLGGSRMSLIGEFASYIIKDGSQDIITNSYEDKTLANYCFNTDTNTYTVALSKSGDGRSCVLMQYNSNGDNNMTVDADCKADSVSSYKGVIAVLDGNIVYGYNSKGEQLYAANAGTGSKRIVLTGDSTAYVLSVNQIRLIDLKKTSTADTASQGR